MTQSPGNDPERPEKRRQLNLFGLILGGIALFMFVSFILKTAIKGP